MTISNVRTITSASLALMALTLLAGCGGGGGGSAGGGNNSNPFPAGIYVSANSENKVRRFSDMSGTSETPYLVSGDKRAYCAAFDSFGRMFVGSEGEILLYGDSAQNTSTPFGTLGSGVGQFGASVTGLAFDSQDRLYIADAKNRRIVRINDFSTGGWVELDLSSYATALDTAMSVALDSQDRIYVTLSSSCKILRFDSMADTLPDSLGSSGSGAKQFQHPTDIHFGHDGKIYVCDKQNNRIARFDDFSGANWTTYGSLASLQSPTGVATDSAGHIYIADYGNKRVVRINDMSGAGWTSFGSSGGGSGQFQDMYDILVR